MEYLKINDSGANGLRAILKRISLGLASPADLKKAVNPGVTKIYVHDLPEQSVRKFEKLLTAKMTRTQLDRAIKNLSDTELDCLLTITERIEQSGLVAPEMVIS